MKFLVMLLLLCTSALTQETEPIETRPATAETDALLDKAVERIANYKQVLIVSPHLSREIIDKDSNAAKTALETIGAIRKNGPTAYSMVAMMSLLDDLTLDAAGDSSTVLNSSLGKVPDGATIAETMAFASQQSGFYDISELWFHATMRYVKWEDDMLFASLKALNQKFPKAQ